MMNILIVSHFGGSYNHIASNRINSMKKYLEEFNHVVQVVTLARKEHIDEVGFIGVKDRTFFKRASFNRETNKVIHLAKAMYNRLWIKLKKSEDAKWINDATNKCRQIIREHNIDLILTSYGPFSAVTVGYNLKREFTDLKWIVDMRDDFSYEIEKKTFQHYVPYVDSILTVSEPILKILKIRYEKINSKVLFEEVRNGYDFDPVQPLRRINNTFTIVFTGSLYGEISPNNFLKAVEELKFKEKISNFHIKFVGVRKPLSIPKALLNNVEVITNRVPYHENINIIKSADAVLLILPESNLKGVYSGKLFDYIGCGRPILGLVPDDVAKKLILDSKTGIVAPNEDIEKIEKAFMEIYSLWESNSNYAPEKKEINYGHRRTQIKILERAINKL